MNSHSAVCGAVVREILPGLTSERKKRFMKDLKRPDFVAIATPLVLRGFRVTPVHPLTKCGVMKNWNNKQITTQDEVLAFAKYYHSHNVAVVGKRAVYKDYPDGHKVFIPRHCFFDDDAGIAGRIEQECGQKIPQTYRVQSRPDTNPSKQHFYFLQTEYSFKKFAIFADNGDPYESKNVNRRNLTKFEFSRTGLQIHPTMYDLKGIGKSSFVVASGSLRAPDSDGRVEKYTCVDESEPVDIPSWLVDWFVQDIQEYRKEKFQEKKAKHARNGHDGGDTGYKGASKNQCDICQEDVYDYIRWRAGQLTASVGLAGDGLEAALRCLIIKDCEKGEVFVSSEHGKELIHEIVEGAEEWDGGTASPFYLTSETTSKSLEGSIMIHRTPSKQEVIERIVKGFADKISAGEALDKIEESLFKDGYTFDRYAERSAIYRARKANGFAVLVGHHSWIRKESL